MNKRRKMEKKRDGKGKSGRNGRIKGIFKMKKRMKKIENFLNDQGNLVDIKKKMNKKKSA